MKKVLTMAGVGLFYCVYAGGNAHTMGGIVPYRLLIGTVQPTCRSAVSGGDYDLFHGSGHGKRSASYAGHILYRLYHSPHRRMDWAVSPLKTSPCVILSSHDP